MGGDLLHTGDGDYQDDDRETTRRDCSGFVTNATCTGSRSHENEECQHAGKACSSCYWEGWGGEPAHCEARVYWDPAAEACHYALDVVEYVGMSTVVLLMLYLAWISNSYALEIEQGVGRSLSMAEEELE
jgi:hypothetical protein